MDVAPQVLLRRLDDRLSTDGPSAGRVYATALRALVVAVEAHRDAFVDARNPLATTAFLVHRFLGAESAVAHDRPDDVPLPWRPALALDPDRSVFRQLLVTANAGFNDDLPRALLDLPGGHGDGSRADHETWTGLAADAFADVACGPATGALDRLLVARERPLVRRALAAAATQAWRNAGILLDARAAADRAARGDEGFDELGRRLATLTVGGMGELLTRHRWPAPRWSEVLVVRLRSG